MSLKIGDVVQLKSGGPWMTVIQEENEDGKVRCGWFRKINGEWMDSMGEFYHSNVLRGKPGNSLVNNK